MAYMTFFWWDYILFFIIVSISAAIGIYYGFFDKSASTGGNFHVEKQSRVLPVAFSLIASTITVSDLLGVPAEIYTHGTQFWVEIFSFIGMGAIVYVVHLPVYWKLKLGNPYEYLELRFDQSVRKIMSFLFLASLIFLIPLFIYAPSLAFSQVSGINVHLIALAVSLTCIFYTTIGGFKAVIWADTLQYTITLSSLSFALIMGITSAGGFGEIWKTSEEGERIEFFQLNPNPTIRTTFWNVFIGNLFRWAAYLVIHPAAVQRLVSVPTLRDSRRVIIIFVALAVVTKSILCFLGLVIYAKYFECDPVSTGRVKSADQIVPYYLLDVARQVPGLGTTFMAGLFSVSLSVLSTSLNIFASSTYADWLAPLVLTNTTERKARNIIKILTLVAGMVALCLVFVAEKLGSLFELNIIFIACAGGVLLGIFTMGMIFPFANTKGVLSGGFVSAIFMLWFIIKTQMHVWNGTIKYESKPFYTNGCNETSLNKTVMAPATSEEPFWLFRISFHYYILIGCLICMVVGLSVSWVTATTTKNHTRSVNPELLSPIVHNFLKKSTAVARYESVEYSLDVFKNEERSDGQNR